MMPFQDRQDAGRQLAERLIEYAGRSDILLLALPRGGVPVAYEVSIRLQAPLDVFIVRKLGVPGHEELAMGAIAPGRTLGTPIRILNQSIVDAYHLTDDQIDQVTQQESCELERRERAYRDDRPLPVIKDRTVILIDDGLATGATMRVAALALRQQQVAQLVIAVPVAAPKAYEAMRQNADALVCVTTPQSFYGVGQWYADFSQTTDEQVKGILAQTSAVHPTIHS